MRSPGFHSLQKRQFFKLKKNIARGVLSTLYYLPFFELEKNPADLLHSLREKKSKHLGQTVHRSKVIDQ